MTEIDPAFFNELNTESKNVIISFILCFSVGQNE